MSLMPPPGLASALPSFGIFATIASVVMMNDAREARSGVSS
ncbi:MAG TPA: hypothetical protein VFE23_12755 [Usitatibacter sp.]|jgi:hypothetical protein|nr:hypothetical protein [Usitatibacter sp.]